MPQGSPTEDVMTVLQAAEALGISRRTVVRRIKAGDLPATKLGPGTAAYLIARQDVESLLPEAAA